MPVLARAASRYWLTVFPDACLQARRWRARAKQIPDPTLRAIALRTHGAKRRNLEGAAAFAAFAQPDGRHEAVCAAVAYQAMFDYLDDVSEEASDDPIANGRRLHSALLRAVVPELGPLDYYALCEGGQDGGYLEALIDTCRGALGALPSFATIRWLAREATERVIAYQSLNHGDGNGRHDAFERWARACGRGHPGLRWWETGAAAGSTLDLLALIAAASHVDLSDEAAAGLAGAYFPWVGALHSLLDSLADQTEDTATGKRGLIDYYATPEETAERLALIAAEAMRRVVGLRDGDSHALTVAAMASFYLCDLSSSRSPHARLASPLVVDAIGRFAKPTGAILGTRCAVGGALDRLARLLTPPPRRRSAAGLETQVFDFPLV